MVPRKTVIVLNLKACTDLNACVQMLILSFLFIILFPFIYCFLLCFITFNRRSLRFSLRFGSFRLPAPTTAFQSALTSPPGCRDIHCSQTRRGETHRRSSGLKEKNENLYTYPFLSPEATSCLVTWSLQLTPVPVLPTLGAVAC